MGWPVSCAPSCPKKQMRRPVAIIGEYGTHGGRCNRYLACSKDAPSHGVMVPRALKTTRTAVWQRWLLLLLGDVCTAFGVACFFRTYMPLQVYELFVAEVAKRFSLNINKVKWTFDIFLLVLSATLALALFCDAGSFDWSTIRYASYHSIGLGTLVTTAINSPVISLMGKLIDRIFEPAPRFARLEKLLHNA